MKNTFPRIDFSELRRLRDIAQIPAKKAKSPRAVGAWRLATMTKELEATEKLKARAATAGIEVKKEDVSKSSVWQNVVHYLTSAVAQGDFTVLDEFATAWIAWQIKPDVIIADFANGFTLHSGESVTNKKGRPLRVAVIESITRLQQAQNSPDRAPSFQEIQVDLQAVRAIDETELSRQLKALGIQNRIPHEGDL